MLGKSWYNIKNKSVIWNRSKFLGRMYYMKQIGILGFGVVGSGVAEVLKINANGIANRCGESIRVKSILDIRDFSGHPLSKLFTKNFNDIVNDHDIAVVVEAMGGSHPAYDFTKAALQAGKSVVTSNKEVVAKLGQELTAIAKKNGVHYLFEASVGGGIPVIRPIGTCLAANEIRSVTGIVNGTTNYILTEMFEMGRNFEEALADAMDKGYAEKNPSADVDGIDACRKICILSDIIFGYNVSPEEVKPEGIRSIRERDVQAAEKAGYSIKLLARAEKCPDGGLYILVCPFFVNHDNMLAGIRGVFNGILVDGNATDEVLFYGKGAGKMPTASAMVADVINIVNGRAFTYSWTRPPISVVKNNAERSSAFYLSVEGEQREAFFAAMGGKDKIFYDHMLDFISDIMPEKEADKIMAAFPGVTIHQKLRVLG
ncbi:MAG TPA: homoserine dehydrogenase [Clostridiales bacterium]|jgi:homoserine dehydrogenase|nr:homoserine dehydrogenase [Clostridiales bacterium]